MIIYGFQILCDVSSEGWGYALIWHMGESTLIWRRLSALGFWGA
jgi:hypothetical protein